MLLDDYGCAYPLRRLPPITPARGVIELPTPKAPRKGLAEIKNKQNGPRFRGP